MTTVTLSTRRVHKRLWKKKKNNSIFGQNKHCEQDFPKTFTSVMMTHHHRDHQHCRQLNSCTKTNKFSLDSRKNKIIIIIKTLVVPGLVVMMNEILMKMSQWNRYWMNENNKKTMIKCLHFISTFRSCYLLI